VPNINDALECATRPSWKLFYSTGLRRLRVVPVGGPRFNAERRTLMSQRPKGKRPHGAGREQRAVGGKILVEVRPGCAWTRAPRLFLTGYGGRSTPTCYRACYKMDGTGRVERRGSCHLLRHTCATHMLEGGATSLHPAVACHEKLEPRDLYRGQYPPVAGSDRLHPSGQLAASWKAIGFRS